MGGVSYQTTESARRLRSSFPVRFPLCEPQPQARSPPWLAGSLREHFSRYGEITDCFVMRDKATGKPRGFAFCCFKDPEVAQLAVSGAPAGRLDLSHRAAAS